MKKRPRPATDLVSELKKDPEFVARQDELERERTRRSKAYLAASAQVVGELNAIGLPVESIDDLRERGKKYEHALPVLLKWLPIVSDPAVKESIVRALSVPFAKPMAAQVLIGEFVRTTPDQRALKWSLANALSIVGDDSVFEELAAIVQDRNHGKAREMLAVALGNMKNPRATAVLVDLLADEDVAGHALIGLGNLAPREARAAIEPFLRHRKPWVRKEARRALDRIARRKDR